MPKRFPHAEAARVAGEVFGKILNRQADRGGYEYVLDCFESGKKSVQDIVLEFISSDEFIDKFASSANAANLINWLLLGRDLLSETEVRAAQRQLIRLGIKQYADLIVRSRDYVQKVGPDRVPGSGHKKFESEHHAGTAAHRVGTDRIAGQQRFALSRASGFGHQKSY